MSGTPVSTPFAWFGSLVNLRAIADVLRRRLTQVLCGITGHEVFVWRGEGRITLRCGICASESRGWHLTSPPPVLRYSGDPARHVIDRATLSPPRPARRRDNVVRIREAS